MSAFCQLGTHRRGILGAFILTAVGHGGISAVSNGETALSSLSSSARPAKRAAACLTSAAVGIWVWGAGSRSVLGQRGRQSAGGIFIAQGIPCRLTAVDGIGNVTDKGRGVRLRGRHRRPACRLLWADCAGAGAPPSCWVKPVRAGAAATVLNSG